MELDANLPEYSCGPPVIDALAMACIAATLTLAGILHLDLALKVKHLQRRSDCTDKALEESQGLSDGTTLPRRLSNLGHMLSENGEGWKRRLLGS